MKLAEKKCPACSGALPLLGDTEQMTLLRELQNWRIIEGRSLEKKYPQRNFAQGLAWVNRVAEIAETEGHHPDIVLRWSEVCLNIWTHAAGGLTESDFILAAKIDAAEKQQQ